MKTKPNNYLTQDEYNFVFARTPRPCIDIIITTNGKNVLLGQRSHQPFMGQWALIGGRHKFGFSFQEGIIDKIFEETGLNLIHNQDFAFRYFGCMEFLEEINMCNQHSVSFVFVVELLKEFNFTKTRHFLELKNFEANEIHNLDMVFQHKEILKLFLNS